MSEKSRILANLYSENHAQYLQIQRDIIHLLTIASPIFFGSIAAIIQFDILYFLPISLSLFFYFIGWVLGAYQRSTEVWFKDEVITFALNQYLHDSEIPEWFNISSLRNDIEELKFKTEKIGIPLLYFILFFGVGLTGVAIFNQIPDELIKNMSVVFTTLLIIVNIVGYFWVVGLQNKKFNELRTKYGMHAPEG